MKQAGHKQESDDYRRQDKQHESSARNHVNRLICALRANEQPDQF